MRQERILLLLAIVSLTSCRIVESFPENDKATPGDGTPGGKLLSRSDLVYKGAFRVPRGKYGVLATDVAASFSYGGGAPTYNPVRNSLILETHWTPTYSKTIAEISIPAAINSLNRAELNTAVMVQNPIDITNGQWDNLALDGSAIGNGGSLGGLLVYNNSLFGAVYGYYDAAYEGHRSHFRASLHWDTTGTQFQGMYRVGISPSGANAPNGGFVGGYMGHIPPNWQAALGGPVLTGKGSISIISRSSLGPSAWVFNPKDLGTVDPVPATPLVYYPGSHPTLGTYGGTSLYYNMATQLTGIVFPEGSRTVLFFGRHGLGSTGQGNTCYGPGTSDLSLVGTLSPGFAEPWCYDPSDSSKGTHGYPYVSQVWAYDAMDFLKVKNGTTNPATGQPYQPWEIVPYAVWQLDLPFKRENAQILGAAYDPVTQRIFVSQAGGDAATYDIYPMIHVFEVYTAQ